MKTIKILASTLVCFISFIMLAMPVKATGTTYSGSNVEAQNYSTWSSTVESYLVPTDKGLMRVQAASSIDGYLVEYYDANYNVTSSLIVPEELPVFGAFYAYEGYYYILSGQNNPTMSSHVECFRITKYDSEWNYIESIGKGDCFTTVPFDAGSARIAAEDDYMIVYTCHERYDGHQSSFVMELNPFSMKFYDSDVTEMRLYSSHSFNQFVMMDDSKIVSVFHGDGAPIRAIYLQAFKRFEYSEGIYDEGIGAEVLSIYGSDGDNYTGTSLGGIAASDSHYFVAGNSVIQDGVNRKTRNVYLATVDKTSGELNFKWITSYAEDEITTSTPHLVEYAENEFMLMWEAPKTKYSNIDYVYYTKINSSGELVGDIYSFEGYLSDCVPVVQGSKLIWYTWENAAVKFYEINTKDMSAKVMYKDGLVLEDGVWKYYEDNQWISDKKGLVEYEGELFLVTDGYLRNDINGLCLTPTADGEIWYFYSAGHVQKQYTGFAEYNGAWFYLNKGELDTTKTGIYEYDGGYFLLAEGRLIKEYKGLYENTEGPNADGKWYFFGDGKLQDQYTGLAEYDGKWFYLKKGCLAEDYTGKVKYDGQHFEVVNGMVQ